MPSFVSWAVELQRFKDAMANQPSDVLLKAGYTNAAGQTVTFKRYEDLHLHLNYLTTQASKEANPGGRRRLFMPIGYRGRC
jgi:hypothetical protein